MHERGLVASYADYLDLPWAVVEDFRMLAEGLALEQQRQEQSRARNAPRGRR